MPEEKKELKEVNKDVKKLISLIRNVKSELREINDLAEQVDMATRTDYSKIDGIMGTFDGVNLVTDKGEKYEIPGNYAAKSKFVYGDGVKLIEEENGTKLFKQISKVERQEIEGVLNKKEGIWYALTNIGSYAVSPFAADFQKAEVNDKVLVFVPKDNKNAPFATIETVIKKQPKTESSKPVLELKKEEVTDLKPAKTVVLAEKPVSKKKPAVPKKEEAKPAQAALDDDDLR